MINLSGTGSQASSVLITTTEPEGFYSLGVVLDAVTPLPPGGSLRLYPDLSPNSPERNIHGAVVAGSASRAIAMTRDLFLAPGAQISYEVVVTGANPAIDWTAKVVLLREQDVS